MVQKTWFFYMLACFAIALILSSCYGTKRSKGGGHVDPITFRKINPTDIALPTGYTIEVVTKDLTYPTGIDFDEEGNIYIIEAGYAYGEEWTTPQLLKINKDGRVTIIAKGKGDDAPWNGLDYNNGNFYIAAGGHLGGGKILKINREGSISVLTDSLPSLGDHHTNGPVVMDDYIYFGQGTVTNSSIVGEDNLNFGWLKRHPDLHDIPCEDIVLTGKDYTTKNFLNPKSHQEAATGAFLPFNNHSQPGQIIQGSVPCNGAIMRMPLSGGEIELVAWGLRNPFGLTSYQGKLFVTDNSYDERGSRPVWGTGDVLWEISQGTWYGWPDYAEGKKISDGNEFKAPGGKKVSSVLAKHPGIPPQPKAILGVHSSCTGLDFSTSSTFGYEGQVFIAEFGDMADAVGKLLSPVGFKVVRVNITDGVVEDFAVNKGKKNGPASWLKRGGLERPIAVKFNTEGNALYVLDFGILRMSGKEPKPQQRTGILWKITKTN